MDSKKNLFVLLICFVPVIAGCKRSSDVYEGYVEGNYTYLSSPFGGKLQQLAVSRGTLVKKNTLLFKLDPQPELSQLKQAQDNLRQAQQKFVDLLKGKRPEAISALIAQREQVLAQLNLDRKTLIRYRRLVKTGAIDQASLDSALAAFQADNRKIAEIDANLAEAKLGARINQVMAQQAAVEAAKASVKQAKWSLQQKTVVAPVTGEVFDTYFRKGEFVSAGHPVVSILAPQDIKLIFFVAEPILSKIKIGQTLTFNCDGCKKTYSATINFISSKAEYTPPVIYSVDSRDKLVFRVEAKIPENDAKELKVGQPVDVKLS